MSKKAKFESECLLGKKRDKPDKSSSSSSDDEKDKPVKSIFGDKKEEGFKKGLFGDLSKPSDKPGSLFANTTGQTGGSLFGSSSGGSLFGGSLFSNINKDNKEGSLFGNQTGSLFSNTSSLFSQGNINLNKGKDDNESGGEEGDDQIGKSNSPNPYNPEEDAKKEEKEGSKDVKKLYVKKVDNFYVYNKEENKYITKGDGFVSIETSNKDGKKYAFILFRNNIGNLLYEGILNDKFNKFDSYEKKFKFIAHFYFLVHAKKEENKEEKGDADKKEEKGDADKKEEKGDADKKDKAAFESGNAKIPFLKEEDCKAFGEKYKEAIQFLKGDDKAKK